MSDFAVWGMIIALGVLTYLIRFSFVGLLRGRELPPLVMSALRYVPTAILPALVAPMVVLDRAGGWGSARDMAAAAVVILAGAVTRSALWAIVAGFGSWHLLRLAGV